MTDLKAELLKVLRGSRSVMLAKLDGLSEYDRRRPITPTGTNLIDGRITGDDATVTANPAFWHDRRARVQEAADPFRR